MWEQSAPYWSCSKRLKRVRYENLGIAIKSKETSSYLSRKEF